MTNFKTKLFFFKFILQARLCPFGPPPAISLLYWRRAVAFEAPFDHVNKLMCNSLYGKINAMFGVEYQALIHVRGRQAVQNNVEKLI
jgi:hypothetical protein